MANTKKVFEGLQILLSYVDKQDGYHLGAEHDEIFFFGTDRPVSEEDLVKLEELGWDQHKEESEDEGYDKDSSWRIFV